MASEAFDFFEHVAKLTKLKLNDDVKQVISTFCRKSEPISLFTNYFDFQQQRFFSVITVTPGVWCLKFQNLENDILVAIRFTLREVIASEITDYEELIIFDFKERTFHDWTLEHSYLWT